MYDHKGKTMSLSHEKQAKIAATYMRGGTCKGVFFSLKNLPAPARVPGEARDRLMLSILGSADPYAKQIDGMGGATSSTSKSVIVSRSTRPDHDVDCLFGQVSIDTNFVDWSGNCGNLSAAVGAFAVSKGLVDSQRIPQHGFVTIRIWQVNIGKTVIAKVPVADGSVQELGDFELDGVTFPAAEIELTFVDPAAEEEGANSALFPTGNLIDTLDIPGIGAMQATLINAGIPTIFIAAESIGYTGTELQDVINQDPEALSRFELIRAYGAVQMGLISSIEKAAQRQHTPKIAFVAPPQRYASNSGKVVTASDIDLLVRALSMGKLHHAMMGTAAVAIGTAAAIPGTLVSLAAGGRKRSSVRFGHPSGTLRVGAVAQEIEGDWTVTEVSMSRSARMLMEGWVCTPKVW